MQKAVSRKETDIRCVILGMMVCVLAIVILTMGTAQLLVTQKIGERCDEILVSATLFIASIIGNVITGKLSGNLLLAYSATSISIVLVMIISGCIIDGPFENVMFRIGAVVAGGLFACMTCSKISDNRTKRKRRHR